jgi:hypothetical protein
MREPNQFSFYCSNIACNNEFLTECVEHKGVTSDFGSWIVRCEKCGEIFSIFIGEHLQETTLLSGGEIIGAYDAHVYSDMDLENQVLKLRQQELQELILVDE